MEATFIDRKVSEIWETVNRKNRQLMKDWIEGFIGSYDEQKQKSQQEIRNTAIRLTEPGENFLWRLMSAEPSLHGYYDRNGIRKRRVELAMLFLRAMTEDKYWTSFITLTLSLGHSKISRSVPVSADSDTTQPCIELYKAARLEKVEEVRRLIETGLRVKPDVKGFTPLHSAAMAINPNARIAHLLLELGDGRQYRNVKADTAENTALHYAAANVNVTEDFIVQFMDADPELRNVDHYTPFHVAAMSCNPDAIIYMLNTFAPTNKGWDVDKVDEESAEKVINLCARNGNAKAVALLIKHGADISRGVLHEIVLESVRYPEKIDKLLDVYNAIVDNAVTWRYLEEGTECQLLKGSRDCIELFRKTMIWLLTNPLKEQYENKDVLQWALEHGASAMFLQIINTKSVFCAHGEEALQWISDKSSEDMKIEKGGRNRKDKKDRQITWTTFDVTNFTTETHLTENVETEMSDLNSPSTVVVRPPTDTELCSDGRQLKSVTDKKDEINADTIEGSAQPNTAKNKSRNFDRPSAPDKPYVAYVLDEFDKWKNTNILSIQPLRGLTEPYVAMSQRFYFLVGLIQLIFMIYFTDHYMPSTCSLASMFSIQTNHCNTTNANNTMPPRLSEQRSWLATIWLIWPTILLAGHVHFALGDAIHAYDALKEMLKETKTTRVRASIAKKFYESLILGSVLSLAFSCMVFHWIILDLYKLEAREPYIEATAMVLLFGWLANLEFFGGMSKHFGTFLLVVKTIIAIDIPCFMLFFGFTIAGFSFSMHLLRISTCRIIPKKFYLHHTFFGVLSTAFGIGDLFDKTVTNDECADAGMKFLFEIVYFGYVCMAMIILLNLLIAMMNHRYEKAKWRAGNLWRFHILSTMRHLENTSAGFLQFLKKILDLWRSGNGSKKSKRCKSVLCCSSDASHASLIYKNGRYYLTLLLLVDKQATKDK